MIKSLESENQHRYWQSTERLFKRWISMTCAGIWDIGARETAIDWCCFYYFVRNSLLALLEAPRARIFSFRFVTVNISFLLTFYFCARSLTKPFFRPSREQEPAQLLMINGETLQAMNLDDACRYLGYWGTRNGDMRATKEVVRQKIIAARDLIKCHPLTPELATEFLTSKGMGVFRFSLALSKWCESKLNDVKQLCIQAYKNAWHLPRSTASALFILPKTHAGKESTLPMAVLTQAWGCVLKNHAGRLKPHVRRVFIRLLSQCWTNWGNGTVEVKRRNRRILVETSKSTAAEQHLSHVGRAVGQQTGISAYHWKIELGCSN